RVGPAEPSDAEPIAGIAARCPSERDVAGFYAALAERGLVYGPSFQGVEQVRHGDGEALGRLRAPDARGYGVHPALLAAAFQAVGALGDGDADGTYLPVHVGRFALGAAPGDDERWSHVRLRPAPDADTIEADVVLRDGGGRALATVGG